jgi:hypothetical protein
MSGAPDTPWLARLAALSLALVLAVAATSAYLRLGTTPRACEKGLRCAASSIATPSKAPGIALVRAVQRVAASMSALTIIALAVIALRRRGEALAPALGALGLAAALTAIGLAYGVSPPPGAALANLLGGVALTALLAWLLGRLQPARAAPARVALPALALLLAQSAFGAWLSTRLDPPALALALAHAALGLAAAAAAILAGLRLLGTHARLGLGLAAAALLALAAGLATLALDAPFAAGVAHNAAASLLAAALAYAAALAA